MQDLTDELAEHLGYEGESGVVVAEVEPGSPAARAGITAGTLIQQVGRKRVTNTKELQRLTTGL